MSTQYVIVRGKLYWCGKQCRWFHFYLFLVTHCLAALCGSVHWQWTLSQTRPLMTMKRQWGGGSSAGNHIGWGIVNGSSRGQRFGNEVIDQTSRMRNSQWRQRRTTNWQWGDWSNAGNHRGWGRVNGGSGGQRIGNEVIDQTHVAIEDEEESMAPGENNAAAMRWWIEHRRQ